MATDFIPLGEHSSIGNIPKFMLAQTIRESRFGEPKSAILIEKIPVPEIGPHDVLVYVMAAGVNYNIVWASLGIPVNVIENHNKKGNHTNFHIGGSEGSGIVWKIGDKVTNVKIGDEVILHSGQWDYDDPHILAGRDPTLAPSLQMYGYESNYGSLAQFTRVQEHQCLPKPPHLTWEEASAFMVGGAAAYRMLHGWPGNTVQEGDPVLIWGGAGSLGCMAIQIAKIAGAKPVVVVSNEDKYEYCRKLGAVGFLNRNDYDHWGMLPHWSDQEAYNTWLSGVRKFGKDFWEALGEKRNPALVIEHPGEDTIPTSIFIVDNGGMVVICGGTSGYNATLDLRYHWMRQKRLQGSHFANHEQCQAVTQLINTKQIDPCLSKTFLFEETGLCHQLLHDNKHPSGNMSILVNASKKGMTTL